MAADDDGTLSDAPSETRARVHGPLLHARSGRPARGDDPPLRQGIARRAGAGGGGDGLRSGPLGRGRRRWACRRWRWPKADGGAGRVAHRPGRGRGGPRRPPRARSRSWRRPWRLGCWLGSAAPTTWPRSSTGAPPRWHCDRRTPGVARLVPGAAVAGVVVALDGDRLVAARRPASTSRRTLASLAVADVDLDRRHGARRGARRRRRLRAWPSTSGGPSRPSRRPGWPGPPSTSACSTPRTATSSACRSGASRPCSTASPTCTRGSTAAACSPTRPCGRSTRTTPTARALAAQASWWCGEVADEAAGFSLHVHGGYGFMLEYDVQLHVRRAKATRLLLGDPAPRAAADRRAPMGSRTRPIRPPSWPPPPTDPPEPGMDFRFEPETEAFRSEVRAFIAEHLDDEIVARAHATGTMHDWGFHRALCERGYLAAGLAHRGRRAGSQRHRPVPALAGAVRLRRARSTA